VPDQAEDLLDEEHRLVLAAQAGDMDALRPVFARYASPLYGGVILPRLGNAAAAEDVLTETFVAAIEKIRTFRWEGRSIYGWLRQIAVNKVIDQHRRARRGGRVLAELGAELADEPFARTPADEALIAEQERQRNAARIKEVLADMSPRYRQAIQLRLIEELPREECARRMEITLGNFDVVLFRAVRAFRKLYAEGETERAEQG
jgi:RNA polymerase sigma-70 factor (ECF subfamily)